MINETLELQIARKFKMEKNYSWFAKMGQTLFFQSGLILVKKFFNSEMKPVIKAIEDFRKEFFITAF